MKMFVTVGNATVPFDRLLRAVDEAQLELGCSGICQRGVSTVEPRGFYCHAALSKQAFERAMADADVVVCHAGVGTLWSAISAGHTPLVMPRRHVHGEIVNDHQLEICAELARSGSIRIFATPRELAAAVRSLPAKRAKSGSDVRRLAPIAKAFSELEKAQPASRAWLIKLFALIGPSLDSLRYRRDQS